MEADRTVSTNNTQNNLDPISFFEADSEFVFIFKKTEKLVSAVYLVSNLFSENEPVKWTLRERANKLLSFIIEYKTISESSRAVFLNTFKTKVLEIVSLLEISSVSGLISSMNFRIIKLEFGRLIEVLDTAQGLPKNIAEGTIDKSFFNVQNEVSIKDKIALRNSVFQSNTVKDNNVLGPRDHFKKSNRQNIILNLLKKKKELTIKDISAVIKDCSEKTIQRELNAFISAGILKRAGERRWSKYSLS